MIWPNSSFANLARCLPAMPLSNLPEPSAKPMGQDFNMGTSQQCPPLRHGNGVCGAATAAGEPPNGTLDCLPTCNTMATKTDSNKATLASSTHARLSNASCARAPMWFPGSVAWNPSRRSHSANCSRHVIPMIGRRVAMRTIPCVLLPEDAGTVFTSSSFREGIAARIKVLRRFHHHSR